MTNRIGQHPWIVSSSKPPARFQSVSLIRHTKRFVDDGSWVVLRIGIPVFINRVPARLTAHEGDHVGFIHKAQLALGPVLFRVRMIDDGGIHEHAAVGQQTVEIPCQCPQVPEDVF